MEQILFFASHLSQGFPTCCTAIKLSSFKILIFGADRVFRVLLCMFQFHLQSNLKKVTSWKTKTSRYWLQETNVASVALLQIRQSKILEEPRLSLLFCFCLFRLQRYFRFCLQFVCCFLVHWEQERYVQRGACSSTGLPPLLLRTHHVRPL